MRLGDLTIEIARFDALAEQLEAAHLGLNQATPVIAAPLFPDRSLQPARHPQDLVAHVGTGTVPLPRPGILPGGGMTAFAFRRAMASWQVFLS